MSVRTRLALLALALLLTILLAVLLRDVAREVLVPPVLYLLWVVDTFFSFIPQAPIWILLVTIGLTIAIGSLTGGRKRPKRVKGPSAPPVGRVQVLQRWVQHAPDGVYFKRRLAQHLAKLAMETQAHRQGRPLEQIRRHPDNLDAPPDIKAYLKAGLAPMEPGAFTLLARLARRLWPRRSASPIDLDPKHVVQFLENQLGTKYHLEAQHDDN